MRILGLHGGTSNSNLFKFMSKQFQTALGPDCEWYYLDGKIPWERYDFHENLPWVQAHNAERSALEKRVANGKPFNSWFRLALADVTQESSYSGGDRYWVPPSEPATFVIAEKTSFDAAVLYLKDAILEHNIDVIVATDQPSLLVSDLAWQYQQANENPPWKAVIFFSPFLPGAGRSSLMQNKNVCFPFPLFLVISNASLLGDAGSVDPELFYRNCADNIQVLIHEEGQGFPQKSPHSRLIYERLASELRKICPGLVDDNKERGDRMAEFGSNEIRAKDLASMLLSKRCCVLDARNMGAKRAIPFPGGQQETISLRDTPADYRKSIITRFKNDGRQIVIIAKLSEEAVEYCEFLVSSCDIGANKIKWLAGGLREWEAWEMENRSGSDEIRLAYGLPISRRVDVDVISCEDLAGLLLSEGCSVADVREPAEARAHPFPGGQRNVSFLMVQNKPHQTKRYLTSLISEEKRLVAISNTGVRCRQYCSELVKNFGFKQEHVCWLEGGVAAWRAWELKNVELAQKIRSDYSTPDSISRDGPDSGAKWREHSLDFVCES